MNKTLVVLNPMAGHGIALKMFPQVEQALHDAGLQYDVAQTRAHLHAVQLGQNAPAQGYERVIAVGGDGIAHEVVNGLLRASNEGETISLGIIPLGTGNDFVKSIPPALNPGQTRDDWKLSIPRAVSPKTALVDVGKITVDAPNAGVPHPQYFTNGTDVGFGALVARAIRGISLTGMPAYLLAVMQVLVDYGLPRIKLTFDDGQIIEMNTTLTAVTNGRCFGSSFWLTPMSDITDGELNVIMTKGLGRVGILRIIPLLMNGTHLNHPAVTFKKARKVIIESPDAMIMEADGEMPFDNARRMEIEILPKRLRVAVE